MASSGRLSAPNAASVIVVGGGVTGLSAAWWLARSGHDVLVIEKGVIGWEASGRNGGGATHHFSPLFREEQRLWPQMDDLLGYPTEFRPYRIRLAFDDTQLQHHRQAALNAERQGFASEMLDARQVVEMVPIASPDVHAGVFYRFGGHANPHRTVQAYAFALQDLGGRVLQHTEVTGFDAAGGLVKAVRTNRGVVACDSVVIAAGIATEDLAGRLGVRVPTATARAEIVATEPIEVMRYGGVDGNGLYGRQTLRGNLIYGGGPHEWLDPAELGRAATATTPLVLRHIVRRLAEMFPSARHARVLRTWSGFVENTPDGRPIIDRLSDPANVVVATMSSIGFGLSPASGRAIAEIVEAGACSFADISTFALSRFSGLETDWRARRGWLPPPRSAA